MMKENKNDMQAMNLDDLDGVAGGLAQNAAIPGGVRNVNTGGPAVSVRTGGSSGPASMSAGANDLAGVAMTVTPTVGETSGQPKTMMLCPVCNRMTEHQVFSGGREKCMVCGYVQGLAD